MRRLVKTVLARLLRVAGVQVETDVAVRVTVRIDTDQLLGRGA